ncbi:hypothetical protein Tco_0987082 [Tanacetum coccineum]
MAVTVMSQRIVVLMIVIENIVVVMENIAIVYFLDFGNFGIRDVVGFDDTQVVVYKLVRQSFAFQTQDTVAMKNLSFVTIGFFLTSTANGQMARHDERHRYGGEGAESCHVGTTSSLLHHTVPS